MLSLKCAHIACPEPIIFIGPLLLIALVTFIAHRLAGLSVWPAVAGAWLAAVLAWPRIDRPMRRLAGVLLAAGAGLLVAVHMADRPPALETALAANLPIVALLLGVSFLSLVGESMTGHEAVQRERASVWRTMAHVHLIGAVINLSMVTIVGDRIARRGRLDRAQTIALVRSYSAAAFWSPFFVAAAVAATYAPGASPALTIPLGIITALIAIRLTGAEVDRLDNGAFTGYQPDRIAAFLSVSLLVSVLAVHAFVASLSIIVIVAMLSPLFALALMPRRDVGSRLASMVTRTLPSMSSQVVLFLAAGAFAQGIAAALNAFVDLSALGEFAFPLAGYPAVTALIIAGAYVGVHPVVSIAAIASVIAPMTPDASLLAFAFLTGWGIGTASAPLSGINLMMIGRYRVPPREILRWHPRYALAMWGVVSGLMVAAKLLQAL